MTWEQEKNIMSNAHKVMTQMKNELEQYKHLNGMEYAHKTLPLLREYNRQSDIRLSIVKQRTERNKSKEA